QGPPNERGPTGPDRVYLTLLVATLQANGRRITDRGPAAHQRKEVPRRFVPVRMPERSADALLIDGAGRRVLDPRLQHAPPDFATGRIETWREAADHFRHRAAGRGEDRLAVPEGLNQRQAVSFIA